MCSSDLRRAVVLEPERPGAHGLLARQARRARRWEEALVAGGEAVRLEPDEPEWRRGMAVTLLSRPRPDLPAALAWVDSALELDPHDATLHHLAGVVLDGQRRFGEAARAYEEALRLDPHLDVAHASLATGRASDGRFGEALQMLRGALAHDARSEALQQGYDLVVGRMVRRSLRVVLALDVVLGLMVFHDRPWGERAGVGSVLLLALIGLLALVTRGFPEGTIRHLGVYGRRVRGWRLGELVVLTALLAVAVALTLLPPPTATAFGGALLVAVRYGGIAAIAAAVAAAVRRERG